jgi:hypothetical protein
MLVVHTTNCIWVLCKTWIRFTYPWIYIEMWMPGSHMRPARRSNPMRPSKCYQKYKFRILTSNSRIFLTHSLTIDWFLYFVLVTLDHLSWKSKQTNANPSKLKTALCNATNVFSKLGGLNSWDQSRLRSRCFDLWRSTFETCRDDSYSW